MRGLLEKKQELMRRLAAARWPSKRSAIRTRGAKDNTPPPGFFVSVASKELRVYVSGLESTLAGISTSVDSKKVAGGEKDNSRTANFDVVRAAGAPGLKPNKLRGEWRRFT